MPQTTESVTYGAHNTTTTGNTIHSTWHLRPEVSQLRGGAWNKRGLPIAQSVTCVSHATSGLVLVVCWSFFLFFFAQLREQDPTQPGGPGPGPCWGLCGMLPLRSSSSNSGIMDNTQRGPVPMPCSVFLVLLLLAADAADAAPPPTPTLHPIL